MRNFGSAIGVATLGQGVGVVRPAQSLQFAMSSLKGVTVSAPFNVPNALVGGHYPDPPWTYLWQDSALGMTEQRYIAFRQAGFNVIRFFVKPLPFLDSALNQATLIQGVIDAMTLSKAKGFKSVPVIGHDDTLWDGVSGTNFTAWCNFEAAFARAIAANFGPTEAALELINEPKAASFFVTNGTTYNAYIAKMWRTVAAAAPNLTLIVDGQNFASANNLTDLDTSVFDTNTAFTFHPYLQAMLPAQGDISSFVFDAPDQTELDGLFTAAAAFGVAKNIPSTRIIAGEWGARETRNAVNGAPVAERAKALKYTRQKANTAGYGWITYDTHTQFGILDDSVSDTMFAGYDDALFDTSPPSYYFHRSDFGTTNWTKTAGSVAVDQTTDQNGDPLADKFTGSGSTEQIAMSAGITVVGATRTCSIILKRGNFDWVRVIWGSNGAANGGNCYFNLNTGAAGTLGQFGSGYTASNKAITSLGNGWYKCTFDVAVTNGALAVVVRAATADANSTRPDVGSGAGVGTFEYLGDCFIA